MSKLSSLKNRIIWLPLILLLINAGIHIGYWEKKQGGQGHAGGSFGPFCSPMLTYVLVAKFKVGNEFFIYKGTVGNPIKNIMLPKKEVLDIIGQRMIENYEYHIKVFEKPLGNIVGEISLIPSSGAISVNQYQIDFVQLDLWKLEDQPTTILQKTAYHLKASFQYHSRTKDELNVFQD